MTKVKDVMTQDVVAVHPGATLTKLLARVPGVVGVHSGLVSPSGVR